MQWSFHCAHKPVLFYEGLDRLDVPVMPEARLAEPTIWRQEIEVLSRRLPVPLKETALSVKSDGPSFARHARRPEQAVVSAVEFGFIKINDRDKSICAFHPNHPANTRVRALWVSFRIAGDCYEFSLLDEALSLRHVVPVIE